MSNPETSPAQTSGLSEADAARRLQEFGPNALPDAPPDPLLRRLLDQFASPLIYVLLGALVVDVVVWGLTDRTDVPLEAIAIAVILVLNAGLGVWQEAKASAAIAKLRALAAPKVWVLRDGRFVHRLAEELVPGDHVRLEAGDRVPADGTAAVASTLLVDESVLTGESLPIEKAIGDALSSGTLVTRGQATIEVTSTGASSAMGQLAELIGRVEDEATPLERRLDVFGRRIGRWVLLLAFTIAAFGVAVEGLDQIGHILLFAVALAVAAIPEGLPAVMTVTLSLGVSRMARRKAVVRKLAAVEALGSVTVIATDKTGTLTENRMEVRALDAMDTARAVRALVRTSDADLETGAGDPLDLALLRWADSRDAGPEAKSPSWTPRASRPFDAEWKYARFTGDEDGRLVSYVKGAPEVVLERCTLRDDEKRAALENLEKRTGEGFRCLGIATADGERDEDWEWLGVVSLWDPPRPEVPDAIARARDAGIRVLMMTGDHPATAETLATTVGIDVGRVLRGDDVAKMTDDELRSAIADTTVFARVVPEHKLRIVEALQDAGEIVAVTGDGVNDAPALKRADVGVAMGQRGSDVSREVADLVLLDDHFATIVAAIEEGRGIYENVQKFIRFLFATNLSEILVVTIGPLLSFAIGLRDAAGALVVPLTAAQLLWINFVTDGLPALALGLDENKGLMGHAPRPAKSPLLDAASLRFIVMAGVSIAVLAMAMLGVLTFLLSESIDGARTAAFTFLACSQLVFVFAARCTDLTPRRNRALNAAVAISIGLQVAVVTAPGIRVALDAVAPSLVSWIVIGIALAIAIASSRWIRGWVWRSGERAISGTT